VLYVLYHINKFVLQLHFPLHNSGRKCATSISQAFPHLCIQSFPPPPTSCASFSLFHPHLSLSVALFLTTLCAPLGDEKRKTKHTFETVGRVKSRNRQNGKPRATTTDKGRRQKLKPPPKCHPLLYQQANNNIINGREMQGKLNF